MVEKLTLDNICNGAVKEVFERAVAELTKNIKDPNTMPEAKRKITLEFNFEPMDDRSGAQVSFSCKTSLSSVKPVKGSIYLSAAEGQLTAYPRNPRQEDLFAQKPVTQA